MRLSCLSRIWLRVIRAGLRFVGGGCGISVVLVWGRCVVLVVRRRGGGRVMPDVWFDAVDGYPAQWREPGGAPIVNPEVRPGGARPAPLVMGGIMQYIQNMDLYRNDGHTPLIQWETAEMRPITEATMLYDEQTALNRRRERDLANQIAARGGTYHTRVTR